MVGGINSPPQTGSDVKISNAQLHIHQRGMIFYNSHFAAFLSKPVSNVLSCRGPWLWLFLQSGYEGRVRIPMYGQRSVLEPTTIAKRENT